VYVTLDHMFEMPREVPPPAVPPATPEPPAMFAEHPATSRTADTLMAMFASYVQDPATAVAIHRWFAEIDGHLRDVPDADVQTMSAAAIGESIRFLIQDFTARVRERMTQGG
jgi:hypothetical protein